MKINNLLIILTFLAGIVGCHPANKVVHPAAATTDTHAQEQEEMEKSSFDFSHVVVVRLFSEGKGLEVTSIMPAIVAQAEISGQTAKSIFRLDAKGESLILFSRDILKDTSYKTEIKIDDIKHKQAFVFPIVQSDGSLKNRTFNLDKIIIKNQK